MHEIENVQNMLSPLPSSIYVFSVSTSESADMQHSYDQDLYSFSLVKLSMHIKYEHDRIYDAVHRIDTALMHI